MVFRILLFRRECRILGGSWKAFPRQMVVPVRKWRSGPFRWKTLCQKRNRDHIQRRLCQHVEAENVGDGNKEHTRFALKELRWTRITHVEQNVWTVVL